MSGLLEAKHRDRHARGGRGGQFVKKRAKWAARRAWSCMLWPNWYDPGPIVMAAGRHGAWRSLVAHLLWEQRVGGSNPSAPTKAPVAQSDRAPAF